MCALPHTHGWIYRQMFLAVGPISKVRAHSYNHSFSSNFIHRLTWDFFSPTSPAAYSSKHSQKKRSAGVHCCISHSIFTTVCLFVWLSSFVRPPSSTCLYLSLFTPLSFYLLPPFLCLPDDLSFCLSSCLSVHQPFTLPLEKTDSLSPFTFPSNLLFLCVCLFTATRFLRLWSEQFIWVSEVLLLWFHSPTETYGPPGKAFILIFASN